MRYKLLPFRGLQRGLQAFQQKKQGPQRQTLLLTVLFHCAASYEVPNPPQN
jgi:hypothetical protein